MAAAAADKGKSEGEISETFLRNYLAGGGKVVDNESGDELDPENVDDFLKEVGGGEKEQPAARKEMAAKAEKATQTDEEKAAAKQAAADEQARKEAEAKAAAKKKTITETVNNVSETVINGVQPLADRLGALSTVGGIGLLLVILTLLVFTVVQVNAQGDTRLKMLWAMVNGQVTLQGRVYPTGSSKNDTLGPVDTRPGGPPIQPPTGNSSSSAASSSGSNLILFSSSYRGNTF